MIDRAKIADPTTHYGSAHAATFRDHLIRIAKPGMPYPD